MLPVDAPALAAWNQAIWLGPSPVKSPTTPGLGTPQPVVWPIVANPWAPSNSHSVCDLPGPVVSQARSSCPDPVKSPAPAQTGVPTPGPRARTDCQAVPFHDTR